MRNHELKDSLTFWTRTLEQSPQSSTALSNLGTIEQNMGNKKLAMSYYLKAISFDPLDSYSHNDIGTLYFDAGQYGNAIDEFKEAIALYGVNPTYITNLNHAEVEQKGSITRKKILSQLPTQKKIKKPIKSENEYQEEIQMYLQENDINDAIKTLEQATTDYHINSNFYDDLGVLYISQKNYNKALLNLQNAIAIDPGKDAYYYNLGITLEALGRQKDAKKAFQTALNLNQNDAQVKKELENLEIKGF